MNWLDLFSSVASGGATGLLGGLCSAAMGVWKTKIQQKHDLAVRKLEIDELRIEGVNADKKYAHETEIEEKKMERAALKGGLKADAAARIGSYNEAMARLSRGDSKMLHVADFIRAMIRPVIIFYLLGFQIVIIIFTDTSTLIGQAIIDAIVNTNLYLATVAILWYFGGRVVEKFGK